jgi:hypothetical protein
MQLWLLNVYNINAELMKSQTNAGFTFIIKSGGVFPELKKFEINLEFKAPILKENASFPSQNIFQVVANTIENNQATASLSYDIAPNGSLSNRVTFNLITSQFFQKPANLTVSQGDILELSIIWTKENISYSANNKTTKKLVEFTIKNKSGTFPNSISFGAELQSIVGGKIIGPVATDNVEMICSIKINDQIFDFLNDLQWNRQAFYLTDSSGDNLIDTNDNLIEPAPNHSTKITLRNLVK